MATKKYLDTSGLTRLWAKITSRLSTKVDKESGKGLSTNDYTTAEKTKLSGIATGAEVNQNAFSNVVVGSTTIAADGKTDTLTIAAGTNITLTPDATNDKLTITNSYSLPSAGTSLGGVKSGGVATISDGTITSISEVANPLTLKGNGTTAGTFNGSAATSVDVVGSGSTTVTGASGTITITTPTSIKNPNALTVGSKTYDGSAAITIAASDLGLASAMKFLGTSTTAITDGATTSPITVSDSSITPTAGNVVLYGQKEFVWTGNVWEELGNEGSYKVVQAAIASPEVDGTADAFIDTITQDANGNITATKKSVSLSGGEAAAEDATVVGGVIVSGSTISVAKKEIAAGDNITITGDTTTITIAATDTTYEEATTNTAGLLSAADKAKLDQLSSEAITVNEIAPAEGNITLTAENITVSSNDSTTIYDALGSSGAVLNLKNGSTTGSLRTVGSKEEDDDYTIGEYAFAEGYQTKASGTRSHVQGQFNVEDTSNTYAHIVGNGSSDSERSNAHTLDWNGNAWFAGEVDATSISADTELGITEEELAAILDGYGSASYTYDIDLAITETEMKEICT